MVPFQFLNNKLTMVLKGRPVSVDSSNAVFHKVFDALKDRTDEDEIYNLVMTKINLTNYVQGSPLEVRDGAVYYNGEQLQNSIAKRVESFWSLGLPIEHLVEFLKNIEKNPSYNSRQQLYDFLEHEDLVITDDGHFLAYKAVRSDYTDKRTGKVDNTPGQTPWMDRSKVDDNPNNHCSAGYHVGSIKYVRGFGYGTDKFIIVKVHPADVVSVPNDYSAQKCRVCQYHVLQDMEGELSGALYTSDGQPYKWEVPEVDVDGFDTYEDDYDYDDDIYDYDDEDELNLPDEIQL